LGSTWLKSAHLARPLQILLFRGYRLGKRLVRSMDETWWVRPEDLDPDQRSVIDLPPEGSYLITGPPGSGKSNLLLLRANYLCLGENPNLAILVFTRTLEEFLESGAGQYSFDTDCIYTSTRWEFEFLRRHGVTPRQCDGFEEQRKALLEQMGELLESQSIPPEYQVLLLDEAQDYWPEEIEIFRKLTDRLFAVADSCQKIYAGGDAMHALRNAVDDTRRLRYHYRNDRRICQVADALGRRIPGNVPLLETAHYREPDLPSKVEVVPVATAQEQFETLLDNVRTQLKAYPKGMIGILTPRQEDLAAVWQAIEDSDLAAQSILQHGSGGHMHFDPKARICVSTIHSAKGLEFRALNIANAEGLKRFPAQRKLSYVAVTRAKTSLTVYHQAPLPGYFKEALAASTGSTTPSIGDAFGGPK
jgi:UvrD-like helicase C-terminal domain/AAA domain